LGGRVRIKVVRVDIEAAKIDFTLVTVEDKAGATGTKAPKPKLRDIEKKEKKQAKGKGKHR